MIEIYFKPGNTSILVDRIVRFEDDYLIAFKDLFIGYSLVESPKEFYIPLAHISMISKDV